MQKLCIGLFFIVIFAVILGVNFLILDCPILVLPNDDCRELKANIGVKKIIGIHIISSSSGTIKFYGADKEIDVVYKKLLQSNLKIRIANNNKRLKSNFSYELEFEDGTKMLIVRFTNEKYSYRDCYFYVD